MDPPMPYVFFQAGWSALLQTYRQHLFAMGCPTSAKEASKQSIYLCAEYWQHYFPASPADLLQIMYLSHLGFEDTNTDTHTNTNTNTNTNTDTNNNYQPCFPQLECLMRERFYDTMTNLNEVDFILDLVNQILWINRPHEICSVEQRLRMIEWFSREVHVLLRLLENPEDAAFKIQALTTTKQYQTHRKNKKEEEEETLIVPEWGKMVAHIPLPSSSASSSFLLAEWLITAKMN
jgi:hypothetical protein